MGEFGMARSLMIGGVEARRTKAASGNLENRKEHLQHDHDEKYYRHV
jgi:hypothetical protein